MAVNESRVELLSKDLKELIAKTTFCCAQDDSRPVLKGCLVQTEEDGRISFTALDGYRMAVCRKNILSVSGSIRIICPGRTLNEIGRMLGADEEPIALYVQKNLLMVSVDDTVLTGRLYEGEFVNVKNIVPREFTSEIVADKAALDESVERAAVMARTDKNSVVTFDIREDGMNITGREPESEPGREGRKDRSQLQICERMPECDCRRAGAHRLQRRGFALRCNARGGGFLSVFDPSRAYNRLKTVDSRAIFYV